MIGQATYRLISFQQVPVMCGPIKHRASSGVDHDACEKAQQWPAV